MTDKELDAIEARMNAADVPALIAEVRLLASFKADWQRSFYAAAGELVKLRTENARLRDLVESGVTASERESLRSILNRIEKSLSGGPEVES